MIKAAGVSLLLVLALSGYGSCGGYDIERRTLPLPAHVHRTGPDTYLVQHGFEGEADVLCVHKSKQGELLDQTLHVQRDGDLFVTCDYSNTLTGKGADA